MLIAERKLFVNDIALDDASDGCTLWQPKRQPLPYLLRNRKQLQFFSELSMVAFFCFLKEAKMLIKLRFFEESRTINALEHLVVAVSAPVCSRKAQQFELLDFSCRRNVNTAAQIEEFALLIDRYRFTFRNRIKQFQFQIIADFGKPGSGFLTADFFSYDRQIFANDFFHFLLNLRKVFRSQRFFHIHIVVEAVFNDRTHAELHVFIQALDRLGH
ncbi:hypothetical protein CHCC20348_3979 [Bacillus paralicheniformis]|nr:hypothetical protein CHCC20348_3979 [Bacillus paralicheniformis]